MKRILLAACVAMVASCSTKSDRPAWPNGQAEVDTLKLRQGVVSVDRAVSNRATVKKAQLAFPAEMAAQVMNDWPVGTVVVGQAAESLADRANNPFGFMRKVKAVNMVGAEVVVETENAHLDDVLDGQFHKSVDFGALEPVSLPEGADLSAYDVTLDTSMGKPFPILPNDQAQQPLESTAPTRPGTNTRFTTAKRRDALSVSSTLSVPERSRNIFSISNVKVTPPGRPDLEVKVSGGIDFTPIVSVTPAITIDYDWSYTRLRLDSFEFSTGVDGKLGGRLDTTLSVVPTNPRLSAADYSDALRRFGEVGVKYPIPIVHLGDVSRTGMLGPIPIVATASVFLECTDPQFKGSAKVKTQASILFSAKAGIHYTRKDGWEPVVEYPSKPPTFDMEVVGNNAAVQIDCGIYFRVDLMAAGVAGPYAQLRRSLVVDAKREEVCVPTAPKDHQATDHSQVDVRMYDALQVGAEIDLIVATVERGPYDLMRREYKTVEGDLIRNPRYDPRAWWFGPEFFRETRWDPIWSWSKDRVGAGVTRCEVSCDDGMKTAPDESDVDCGGPHCAKCKKGKTCTANADCGSNICLPNGTCQGVPCDDDAKTEQETDVDCGGPTCSACTAGKQCLEGRDCTSGVCGGNGRCVASLCEDGVKNAQETDVDCGGPTCRPCLLDKVCLADRDCDVGFCSADGASPKTCTDNLCRDGKVSGTEGDKDCGASAGCTQLCSVGQGCNSDADCQSSACNLTTHQCAANKCVDARQDNGETDVDCGGSCQTKCAVGAGCNYAVNLNADCQSGQCASNNRCVATACENKRLDPVEVGTDCSGSCSARCPYNENCNVTADCQSGLSCHPLRHKCQLPGCDDGIQNGQESAIDCGGSTCSKCATSKSCTQNSDCVTNLCFSGRCISGPCENGVKDPTEADIDCGAVCGSSKCGLNKTCSANADCASNICAAGRCISDPCFDLVRNAAETDVDCGGGTCAARCTAGKTCTVNADCASNTCNQVSHTCAASACEDGVKNGTEADIDCGGSCAAKCAINKTCGTGADCASGVCNATTGRCVPDRCNDGVQNDSETAVDCGGACEAKCGFNQTCIVGLDCQSGACTNLSRCAADQCSDGRINGSESAIDCGGTCATKCAVGQGCVSGVDCRHPQNLVGVPGFCAVASHTCASSSCSTGIVDGDESDVDCGGSCSTKCALTKNCTTNSDCQSNICHATRRTCSASQQDDGIKNNDETDIDCGGSLAPGCAVSKGCVEPYDCASGYCSSAGLCLPAYPRTCSDVPFSQKTGTGGLVTIDPDGPRKRPTVTSYVPGALPPVSTYCYWPQGSSDPGFTPIMYLNSQHTSVPTFSNQTITFAPGAQYGGSTTACTTDAQCIAINPTSRCRNPQARASNCSTASCYCYSDEPWPDSMMPPGLRQNPASLSVSQAALRDRAYFTYRMTTFATSGQIGSTSYSADGLGFPSSPYRPTVFRWTAYRNGALVFDSNAISIEDLPDMWSRQANSNYVMTLAAGTATRTQYGTNYGDDNWFWCGDHSLPAYANPIPQADFYYRDYALGTTVLGVPPVPYRMSTSNATTSVPRADRCYGLGGSPIGRDPTTANYFYGLMRARARTTSSGAVGYTGLWWGRYGFGASGSGSLPFFFSYEAPPTSSYMGFCNGMTRGTQLSPANSTEVTTQGTPCQAYHHLSSQSFQWYTNEQSADPNYGSAFEVGVPGLVFVLWAAQ